MSLTLLATSTAKLRSLLRAVGAAMTGLATQVALSRELALNTRVRAVGLVVALLAAVVAATGVPLLFRTVSGEVTVGTAANV